MGVKIGEWIGFGFSEFSGDEFSLNIKIQGRGGVLGVVSSILIFIYFWPIRIERN